LDVRDKHQEQRHKGLYVEGHINHFNVFFSLLFWRNDLQEEPKLPLSAIIVCGNRAYRPDFFPKIQDLHNEHIGRDSLLHSYVCHHICSKQRIHWQEKRQD
jgi:hypothetical protein